MMFKKLLWIFCFISVSGFAQHNVIYSQYFFSGILVNPAYAGSQGALNVTGIYRNQWTGIKGSPKNISLGIHSPLRKDNVNLGLIFLDNKYGITDELKMIAVFAYKIKVMNGQLSFGIQGGINMVKNDFSQIETLQNDDPSFALAQEKQTEAEFGAGLYYKNRRFFIGLSTPALYSIKQNSRFIYTPLMFCSGVLLNITDNLKIKPSVLVKYVRNSPIQADISSTFYLKKILGIGFGYRTEDAAFAYLDLKINDQFNIGYCYDYTLSSLKRYSNGSHEIMLRYLFNYDLNTKNPRYF